MAKYIVEIVEKLLYNVVVEAEDADDAWDVALNTRKFVDNEFDDDETECESIYEVPADAEEDYEEDELA